LENIISIIKGCIAKDHKYQEILYEQYRAYALRIVFRYVYHYHAAIDVVTDGFVKMFSHFDKFQPGNEKEIEACLLGWMRRIMINAAIDHLRRGDLLPEIGGVPSYVWESSGNNNADQQLLYNELVAMIKELPPDYRIVFNLYVIEGYTHSEIAVMMNTTAGTSKSILSRARTMLQKRIRKTEEFQACRI
jgi:RNA polymerase sigma-70 factor (ECF subfamily)